MWKGLLRWWCCILVECIRREGGRVMGRVVRGALGAWIGPFCRAEPGFSGLKLSYRSSPTPELPMILDLHATKTPP